MKKYIEVFCDEFKFPSEAKEVLLDAYDKIAQSNEAFDAFNTYIEKYNNDEPFDFGSAFPLLDKAAEISGVHKFTVHLLFFICLSKHTRELYEKRNISYEIYYDSMSDLKWKLQECHNMHGIWGSFVASWFVRFFELTRFAIGRLQFELIKFDRIYSKGGYVLNPDDLVINIHIPSCGPIKHEDCAESYRRASEFFKDDFEGRPAAFCCNSWLLFPKHTEFLPENSNILKFMKDFDIISYTVDENFGDMWRIFNTDYRGSTADLPRDTSLQRAYIDWIEKGNEVGCGFGVFFVPFIENC